MEAVRREAHVGERNAAGQGVEREIARGEIEVVAFDEVGRPRQGAAARHRCVNGKDSSQDHPKRQRRQNDQPFPYPVPHHSILGRERL